MSDNENYKKCIKQYFEVFDEGPPIWGMSEEEAIFQMREAICKKVRMTGNLTKDLVSDIYL